MRKIRLNENDIERLVKRILKEDDGSIIEVGDAVTYQGRNFVVHDYVDDGISGSGDDYEDEARDYPNTYLLVIHPIRNKQDYDEYKRSFDNYDLNLLVVPYDELVHAPRGTRPSWFRD